MRHPSSFFAAPRILILACVLITLSLPAIVRAGPNDLFEIDTSLVKDLTVDASFGILYFEAGGRLYVYQPDPANPPINLAELVGLMGRARRLLVEEIIPPRSSEYYNGKTARTLTRVLLQFDEKAR